MRNRTFHQQATPGFTLIELLVTVASMTILSSIVVYNCQTLYARAKLASLNAKAHAISSGYIQFYLDTMVLPEELFDPSANLGINRKDLIRNPNDAANFFEPSIGPALPRGAFQDVFPDRSHKASNLIAYKKAQIQAAFPFQGGEKPGCVLISNGPNGAIETNPNWNASTILYDVTNGVISNGDIVFAIPENEAIQFMR